MDIQSVLSSEFQTAPAIIGRIISLIDEGNTIPFIARYRKEMTGAMDDQKLREISERLDYLRGLDKRREAIAASIAEQGKMTDELEKKLAAAATLSELEDVYRPYKQKRRTRAMIAREKGVQPLADAIFAQRRGDDPLRLAQAYVSEEKGVPDAAVATAWILRHPARMQPIAGTTKTARLVDICKASGVELTREEWYRLYLAAGNNLP